MLVRSGVARRGRRRGIVLVLVRALLAPFALVGLSFVLFANASESASNIAKQAENLTRPDFDPEQAMFLFLSQFIYDVPDDEAGVYSALRGHSLARTMYGWHYPSGANSSTNP